MDWVLWGQISLLMVLLMLLVVGGHGAIVDKRREDAIKRRDAGL